MRPLPPLVDRLVPAADVAAREAAADGWPLLALDHRSATDLALLAAGAYSPLEGFLDAADVAAVENGATLADGSFWPVAITLAADADAAHAARAAGRALLVGPDGAAHGEIEVAEVFAGPDGATCVAGPIHGYGRGPAPCPGRHQPPAAVRAAIAAHGWATVAGHVPSGLPDRAAEHAQKAALEVVDGLLALPHVDVEAPDPAPAVRALERLVAAYFPPARVEVAALAAPPRPPDARAAALEALVLRNFGCSHVVLAPATAAAVRALLAPRLADLGLTLLGGEAAFFCRDCGATATARTCPHAPMARVAATPDQLRRLLASGHPPPPEVMRPEVAAVLVAALREPGPPAGPAEATSEVPAVPPPAPFGRTIWFTGRPAAGKTTLALALASAMRARDRRVEVLDADDASADLAEPAPADRAGHLAADRRLAWAAAALNRHGVDAVVAAIAPFQEGRAAARELLGEAVEVYVSCPMERCAARDPKGLYRQAFAGELAGLPGVDAPYEPPEAPDLELRTDLEDVETCVDRLLALIGV